MPFFGMVPNVTELIMRRRVVLNEEKVLEFIQINDEQSNRNSTINQQLPNRTSKFIDFLGGTSPRSVKSPPTSSLQYEVPSIAGNIISNPFHDNKFPVNI